MIEKCFFYAILCNKFSARARRGAPDVATRPDFGRFCFMREYLDDLLFILGAALVTTGAGLIYIPAGLIVGGLFCILGGLLYGQYMALSNRPESSDK